MEEKCFSKKGWPAEELPNMYKSVIVFERVSPNRFVPFTVKVSQTLVPYFQTTPDRPTDYPCLSDIKDKAQFVKVNRSNGCRVDELLNTGASAHNCG